jgi:hypothetical protein
MGRVGGDDQIGQGLGRAAVVDDGGGQGRALRQIGGASATISAAAAFSRTMSR